MPTSNGQVTSRDIRQQAIKTLHILDDAVATAKIPDLAVTFPDKIDDPFWTTVIGQFHSAGDSVTTTQTEVISETVDVPAWVDQVSVIVTGSLQISNTSGSTFNALVASFIDGGGGAGVFQSVAHNETATVVDTTVVNLAGVAGSSFVVSVESKTNSGSSSDTFHNIYGLAIGTR